MGQKYRTVRRSVLVGFAKAITVCFALFCVLTGLLSTVHAETYRGVVRDGPTGRGLKSIQVIYAEGSSVCPLYGMYYSCWFETERWDTTLTNDAGEFSIELAYPLQRQLKLIFLDSDAETNGSYQSANVIVHNEAEAGSFDLTPTDYLFTIAGRVVSQQSGEPIANINVSLLGRARAVSFPGIASLQMVQTDLNGKFSFKLYSHESELYLRATDADGAENGGVFSEITTAAFATSFDTTGHEIELVPDVTSLKQSAVSMAGVKNVVTVANTSVNIKSAFGGYDNNTVVRVHDVLGRTIAAQISIAPHEILWDTHQVARGTYFIAVVSARSSFSTKVVLR